MKAVASDRVRTVRTVLQKNIFISGTCLRSGKGVAVLRLQRTQSKCRRLCKGSFN